MKTDFRGRKVLIAMPVLLTGGTEIQTLNLVRTLLEGDYRVTVCCYYEFDDLVVNRFRESGAEVVLMRLQRSQGLLHFARKLIKLYKRSKPDIIHVQYLAPGLVPIIAARMANISTIFATVHIAGAIAYGRKAKLLLHTAARLCSAFFCVSSGTEEFWFGSSRIFDPECPALTRKHFTIYNAVDGEGIVLNIRKSDGHALRSSLAIGDGPIIGIVGRLAFQKGHAILLDAMADIVRKFPDVVLVIIGDGPDRDKLEMQAKQTGIEDSIRWLGSQPQEIVFEYYGIMHVLAMPSLYEGFGLTAAEAMAARLPVVGTRIDGLSEIIEDGVTGYLVPANDSKKLSEALINLLTDPKKARKMGESGFKRVKELFPFERFKRSTLAAYDTFRNVS